MNMNQAVVAEKQESTEVSFSPRTMTELTAWANNIAKSDLCPKDYRGKPGDIVVAVQWGDELGLKPLQSLQCISVINGRPSVWGDAAIALVRASPLCEYVIETLLPDGSGECRAKRRGETEQVRTFSDADAKTAGLAGKQGPWTQYPKRMKQLRARGFALRDVFADVLRGMAITEEVMDIIERDITPRPVTGTQHAQAAIAQVDESDKLRKQTIEALELVAEKEGFEAYGTAWLELTKEQRTSVGAEEHGRLKEIAKASPANPKVIDQKPAETFADTSNGEESAWE
jgi:hypothetical protein